MLERMPGNIKKAYIISIFIMTFFFLMGIIFNCVELYFGYLVGAIISIININLLVNGVHKILYFQNNPKFRGNFEYEWLYFVLECLLLEKLVKNILKVMF